MFKLTPTFLVLLIGATSIICSPVYQHHRHFPKSHHQLLKKPFKFPNSRDLPADEKQEDPTTLPPNPEQPQDSSDNDPPEKSEARRGINIGVKVKLPTTKKPLVEPEEVNVQELVQTILNNTIEKAIENGETPNVGPALEVLSHKPKNRVLKPAYRCDEWEPKLRACILERNLGDTVTFYLSTGSQKLDTSNKITWRKEYHMKNSPERKSTIIDPENSPDNIIIGNRGYELRVSPITEIDLGFNLFSATIHGDDISRPKLLFMIRIVPIDLGFVYVGETIEINLRSFVSLPSESLSYKWYMEKDGEHGTLPSNMKVTATGSSIKISELRQDQEGILACSVYTNQDFLATKKRYLIKDLEANFGVLKMTPDHNIEFKESFNERSMRAGHKRRSKRADDLDALVSKVLRKSYRSEDDQSDNGPDTDYNVGPDLGADPNAMNKDINNQENGSPTPKSKLLQLDMQVGEDGSNQGSLGQQADVGGSDQANTGTGDFILNIDRFPGRNKVAAEEVVSKLISYCTSDSDCSERAMCIRDNAQAAGFCRCMPGFTGVGIFCRENIWMSNDNYGPNRENPQNPEAQTVNGFIR